MLLNAAANETTKSPNIRKTGKQPTTKRQRVLPDPALTVSGTDTETCGIDSIGRQGQTLSRLEDSTGWEKGGKLDEVMML